MPSKKKSKAKGRKAVGKEEGDANKHAEGDVVDRKNQRDLDFQMQRLQIADKQQADEEEAALLEQAIKLAAVEKKEIEERERENCQHGYNPSPSEERFCKDFMQIFMNSYNAATSRADEHYFSCLLDSFMDTLYKRIRKPSDMECIKSCYLAEGTKSILDGNTNDARIEATITKLLEGLITDQKNGHANSQAGSPAKMAELYLADEHTLVQLFRKRISCSCLDEKYKEVKSITKMGHCWNENCPLPDRRAVRSEMVCCSRCHQENYCSRECQVAAWPKHKEWCNEIIADIASKSKV